MTLASEGLTVAPDFTRMKRRKRQCHAQKMALSTREGTLKRTGKIRSDVASRSYIHHSQFVVSTSH